MSVTRLLVLGAVRIFQPAHGYLVRRELASWQVEEWGHLNPGSVYNALRSLAREGMLVADDPTDAGPDSGSARSAGKVRYRLTGDGETEFQRLVRLGLWEVHPYEPQWLLAGLSFWWALSRREVLDALAARRTQLEARIAATGYAVQTIRQTPFKPEHVVEHFLLHVDVLRGEMAWVDEVTKRVKDGAYTFLGEPDDDAWPRSGVPTAIPKP
jgi:DNA-binding PadR family transcriptional regulator